jgi:hypothetical protein
MHIQQPPHSLRRIFDPIEPKLRVDRIIIQRLLYPKLRTVIPTKQPNKTSFYNTIFPSTLQIKRLVPKVLAKTPSNAYLLSEFSW